MNNLLNTPQQIIQILSNHPDEEFYINELIRLTGEYPNSVQKAVKGLEKKGFIYSHKNSNRLYYKIRPQFSFGIDTDFHKLPTYDWVKLLNRQTFYAFNYIVCKSNRDSLPHKYNISVPSFWCNGVTYGIYYIKEELELLGKSIANILENNLEFAKNDIAGCKQVCDDLINFCHNMPANSYTKFSDKKLADILSQFIKYYESVFPYMTTPHAIERFFENKIREQIKDVNILEKFISPISLFDQERDSALKIASYVKTHGYNKNFEKKLAKHWGNFCWLSVWSLDIEPLSKTYFKQEIINILAKHKDPQKERSLIAKTDKNRSKEMLVLLSAIQASNLLTQQIKLLQEYVMLRTYRKNILCQAHYYVLPMLKEISMRLGLSWRQTIHLSFDELYQGLLKLTKEEILQKKADQRIKGWGILMWKGKISSITGSAEIVKVIERYRINQPSTAYKTRIKGRTACKGKVIGTVKIINDIPQLDKVKKGDILVTKMTTPDYVMVMNRCGGIVTDEGGITCHAAIVSREFGIPCLIATHKATQLLNDYDLVELDATKGFVRVLETVEDDFYDNKNIKGICAYKGEAKGRVVIVLDSSDFGKVKMGDILITSQVTPEFLSCLYRVSGLVVDEQAITSHAVLYAHALKIPTIIGTKYAKTTLYDGQMIELDATKGQVITS